MFPEIHARNSDKKTSSGSPKIISMVDISALEAKREDAEETSAENSKVLIHRAFLGAG